jgi:hypothetical protein
MSKSRRAYARREQLPQQVKLVLIEAPSAPEQPVHPVGAHRRPLDRPGVYQRHGTPRPAAANCGCCVQTRYLLGAAAALILPGRDSATMRLKSVRVAPPAAEQSRSSSMTSISDQPSCTRRVSRMASRSICSRGVLNLMGRGSLADMEHGLTVLRADLVRCSSLPPSEGSHSSRSAPPACAISNREPPPNSGSGLAKQRSS